jgi:hypothetical protein
MTMPFPHVTNKPRLGFVAEHGRSPSRYVSDKAVADFTRVCEQTGLIDKLRKE